MRATHWRFLIMFGAILAGVAAVTTSIEPFAGRAVATPPGHEVPGAAEELSLAFQEVAETIGPSVVSIRAVREIEPGSEGGPRFFFRGSPFGEFFGEEFFERFRMPGQGYVRRGQGSGVIVSADGYILTNSHVVEDADEVTVVTHDDRRYTAEVVGTDDKTDLAVIRVDARGLQPATLGDSDELRVGQWVVAAGNPFGLSSSITAGIVSAKARSRVGVADYEDFIQTDAAINPGNSGGPLVNLRGEVVGINTAIMSRGGGNNGVGFAIPIAMARSVMSDLIEKGRVVRGYLGVIIQDLDEGMAKSFGYDGTDGALVSDVAEGGPAEKAGLKPGDIITRFDGERVIGVDRLRLAVADVEPGTKVKVEVFRDGSTKTLNVRIGELPGEPETMAHSSTESSDLNLGMTVERLTPELAARLGMDESVSGVVVTGVEPLGPAARAGIRVRDVITEVQGEPVETPRDLRRELRRHDLSEGVRLVVRSGSTRRFVFLQIED